MTDSCLTDTFEIMCLPALREKKLALVLLVLDCSVFTSTFYHLPLVI